ncbi:23S rRNA (cytosine1962-C5)-methyltransferase [Formosa sp. Hel1_31_208]|uniref:class I SAM-dependent rRNA methyltransferase n=1 Tax=Formosa sp. Hel1_31_208 TaxID=1798225 RepID=UPI00087958AF|nr:class I SAM-dependent rRNA methyltransferase [Formosa sp. Hel1_31_208]SDS48744.1 23S rRNA (cytosine1962-C5)-methyltransferase [Formosa sp. Hel1_31_208]
MIFSNTIESTYQPKRLAVKLTAKGEHYVQQGHPWMFSDSIIKINDNAKAGDLAIIFGKKKNSMIGIGLYDPNSPIRIKMIYNASAPIKIDDSFFLRKIKTAFQKREPLLKTNTNSYRLLFGENDGFPSLIVDIYNTVLVLKLYSEIWLPYLKTILESLIKVSACETAVIRLSRSLQNSVTHQIKDGEVVYGTLENEVVQFVEHGVNFSANVIKGHKTGYFLDHRENRRLVGLLSKDKSVLDVFSYAGGFSVHALANGAKEVISLDISEQALQIAKLNGKLNMFSGEHFTLAGDAFKILEQLILEKRTFDVVVIDPPSFAKQQSETQLAKKKYAQLASLGEQLTTPNGLLVLASCSSRVSATAFYDINTQTLKRSQRLFSVERKTQHDIDHPIGFEEGAYLKCGYYRFLD